MLLPYRAAKELAIYRLKLVALVVAVLSAYGTACSNADDELRSEVIQVGDTTVVTTHGEPGRLRSDSLRVIWRSPELEDPRALLTLGDRLIVADRTRLHILTETGEQIRTVGREGPGPGEFQHVAALGRFGPDTVAVHDAESRLISLFTAEGDYFGEVRLTPPVPYVNPVNGYLPRYWVRRGLVSLRGGVVSLWREPINWTRPTRTALVWHDLETDTSTVLEAWDGERWFRAGGRYAAHAQLFGRLVIAALAADGRLAVGNGVQYCIKIRIVMQDEFRKVCRDRAPASVGAGIRRPDLTRVENEFIRQQRAIIVEEQKTPEHLPHFDRMLFDEEARLWVRTLGPEFSELHPYVLRDAPELAPPYRTWDVFDEVGHLLTTIEIPSNFEPQVITSREIYGFVELATGEIAIGALEVPL